MAQASTRLVLLPQSAAAAAADAWLRDVAAAVTASAPQLFAVATSAVDLAAAEAAARAAIADWSGVDRGADAGNHTASNVPMSMFRQATMLPKVKHVTRAT